MFDINVLNDFLIGKIIARVTDDRDEMITFIFTDGSNLSIEYDWQHDYLEFSIARSSFPQVDVTLIYDTDTMVGLEITRKGKTRAYHTNTELRRKRISAMFE